MNNIFIEKPYMEYHHDTPFAIARLNTKYANLLSKLALKYEPQIMELNPDKNWNNLYHKKTSSRYKNYNIFLFDSAYMNLFLAVRSLFRYFLEQIEHKPYPCYIRSWVNINRNGEGMFRHTHEAKIIGSFLAFTEGAYTSYGPLKDSNEKDHIFENKDGLLLITKSNNGNFHEVSTWHNDKHPRISYAFDIIEQFLYKQNSNYIPFDGL